MSIVNNPGSKRVGYEEGRQVRQRLHSEKGVEPSSCLERLPFEIKKMVAEQLIELEQLANLSDDWKDVALIVMNNMQESLAVEELKDLDDFNFVEINQVTSAVEFYKHTLGDILTPNPWDLHPVSQIDDSKLEQLQHSLRVFSKKEVKERFSVLKRACVSDIDMHNASFESVIERYALLKLQLVAEAFNLVIGASRSPESIRGMVVECAAFYGYLEIVQVILANDAQISERERGWAVYNAARQGFLPVVEFLLADGNQIEQYFINSAVEVATTHGRLPVVEFLCKRYASPY